MRNQGARCAWAAAVPLARRPSTMCLRLACVRECVCSLLSWPVHACPRQPMSRREHSVRCVWLARLSTRDTVTRDSSDPRPHRTPRVSSYGVRSDLGTAHNEWGLRLEAFACREVAAGGSRLGAVPWGAYHVCFFLQAVRLIPTGVVLRRLRARSAWQSSSRKFL